MSKIQETELKLGDMISNHIKRKGPEEFLESRFVVTNRSNYNSALERAKSNEIAKKQRKASSQISKNQNKELEAQPAVQKPQIIHNKKDRQKKTTNKL